VEREEEHEKEEEEEEGEEGEGGGGIEGGDEAAAWAAVEAAPTGRRREPVAAPAAASAALTWEPAYHALLFVEALFSADGAAAAEAVGGLEAGCGGGGGDWAAAAAPALAAAALSRAPASWQPAVRDASANLSAPAGALNLLRYPHAWVRLAAARVVGAYLAAPRAEPAHARGAHWAASTGPLLALARASVHQLSATSLGPRTSAQAEKNLVHATLALWDATPPAARAPSPEPPAGAGAGAPSNAMDDGDGDGDGSGDDGGAAGGEGGAAAGPTDPVLLVFHAATTAGSFAGGDATKSAVLRWLAACALRLPREGLRRYLSPAARFLHRVTTGRFSRAACAPETVALAGEALELLCDCAGVEEVTRAMNGERARAEGVRRARAAARAQLRVTDPAAAAAERLRRNAAKARAQKRAVTALRAAQGRRK
jgi:U3 small nucleolar RNA-associated protein 20